MATVRAPLMSLNAQGQLGRALIYSTNKGRHTVKSFAVPANPSTLAQYQARMVLTQMDILWTKLTDAQKEAWTPEDDTRIGGQATFLQQTLTSMHANVAPAGALPHQAPGDWPTWDFVEIAVGPSDVITVDGESVTFEFVDTQIMYFSATTGSGPPPDDLSQILGAAYGPNDTDFQHIMEKPFSPLNRMSYLMADIWGNHQDWVELSS